MSNIKQYQDEYASLQVEIFPGCQVKFALTLNSEFAKKEYKNALKKIAKQVSVPGFRKGKAPEAFILKNFSRDLDGEWQNDLAMNGFNRAMKMAQVYPLTKESIKSTKIESCSQEEGATIYYEFEASPIVPEIDPAELKIDAVDRAPVTQEKIDQIIEDIRYQYADWEPIEGRPVELGDFVDVDIENLDQPGEFMCKDTRLEVASGKIGQWLLNLLIGMNVGDSREEMSSQDEGQDNPNFIATRCKVTVNAIQKSNLPAVDDTLAKKAGLESIEQLKEKVVKDLEAHADIEVQQKRRAHLAEAIVNAYTFDLPESIISKSLEDAMSNIDYNEKKDEEIEEMQNKILDEIKKNYCWQLIIQNYVNRKKIRLTEKELIVEALKQGYLNQNSDLTEDREETLRNMQSELLLKKVLDDILEQM